MKIALIGPGCMPIPPIGWGGVEKLIWHYKEKLTALGHEVVIFNSKDLKKVAEEINNTDFDFIHLHYDEYTDFFSKNLSKPFCATSHYGYIMKEDKWSKGFYSIFCNLFKSPGLIVISEKIKNKFIECGYSGHIYTIKVGIDVKNYNLINGVGNGRVICLGKIEKRKKQAFLAEALDGLVDIDFVGPMADPVFKEGKTTKYLGVWSKEKILNNLTDYSCLILFSDGEAAPMVVPEALASGLSVLISESASANLVKKDYITILPDDIKDPKILSEAIKRQISSNYLYREKAREYAIETFDNDIIVKNYINYIYDFIKKTKNIKNQDFFKRVPININWIKYYFSSFWLKCSHVVFARKAISYLRLFKFISKK